MFLDILQLEKTASASSDAQAHPQGSLREVLRAMRLDRTALCLGICCVPISIAVSEFFLVVAFIARMFHLACGEDRLTLPRSLWFGAVWAGAEIAVWTLSPQPRLGWSEIRHLLLLAMLFVLLSGIRLDEYSVRIWQGIFLAATLSSLFLIGDFISRVFYYHKELRVGGDVGLYLRSGGLLNHWMVFATVEIIVVAGLLSFWMLYPEERRRWWPVFVINGIAVVLSLTRMAWIVCLLLLGIDLAWRRSKWLLAFPLLPLALYFFAPHVVRERVIQSFRPGYYSNLERVEMLRVGWKMVRSHPLAGVGPGRVDELYLGYLSPKDPIPAYHAHLHNNLVQLAAEFGLPVIFVAFLFLVAVYRDLLKAYREARDREELFICRTGFLAWTGFLIAGLFEYTYGHSLGLILLTFAVIPAITSKFSRRASAQIKEVV